MKKRKNEFVVVDYDEENRKIVLEEDKRRLYPFALFFFKYGHILSVILVSLSVITFVVGGAMTISSLDSASDPERNYTGLIMEFDGSDDGFNSGSNMSPITNDRAEEIFDDLINGDKTPEYNKDEQIIMVGEDKIIIFDDGSAAIIPGNENEKVIYVPDADDIKYDDTTTTIDGPYEEENSRKTTPDGSTIYDFDDKIIVEKDDDYYLIDKDKVKYDPDGNVVITDDPTGDDSIIYKDFTITNNTEQETLTYRIVLEETSDYNSYGVDRLLPQYIAYKLNVDGANTNTLYLNNNVWGLGSVLEGGLAIENNTYILYEGSLKQGETSNFKLGMWIDYTTIPNEMQNKYMIGTIKVFSWIESNTEEAN